MLCLIYVFFPGCFGPWARRYKTVLMLNSTEHEIFPLINVKMPTVVGILTFMSGKNSILGLYETKKAKLLDIFKLICN